MGAEHVVILALSIIILSVFVYIAWDQMQTIGERKGRAEAQAAVDAIGRAAKEVYYQGEGARRIIRINFPEGVDELSPMIANGTIALKYKGSDIFALLDFPVQGTLPNKSGVYEIEIVFQAGGVQIGAPPFIVTPATLRFVTCSSNQTQTLSQNLTFKNNQNASTSINLLVVLNASDVNITLSETSFALGIGEVKNITVNTTIAPNIVGTFSGKIAANSTNYSVSISVMVVSQACVAFVPPISYLLVSTYKDPLYAVTADNFTLPPNVTITAGNWAPNSYVTIKIFDPNNQIVYENTTQTNSTGGYSFIWPAVGPLGTYKIEVNDSTTLVNTTFNLVSCP